MKRILCFLVMLALAAGLIGCDKQGGTENSEKTPRELLDGFISGEMEKNKLGRK